MRQTELNRPIPLYIAPFGRKATVEALMTVTPKGTLPPGDLEEVLNEIDRRVDRALEGIFKLLPVEVDIDDVSVVNPQHVPFFPATFGDRVYEDPVDVYEQIEELRKGTPLEGLLFDSAGRAFQVHVWASFRREPEQDVRPETLWTLAVPDRD